MRTSILLVNGAPLLGWCGERSALAVQVSDAVANGEMRDVEATLVRLPRALSLAIACGAARCPCGNDYPTHGRVPEHLLFPSRRPRRRPRAGELGGYERNVALCMGGDDL